MIHPSDKEIRAQGHTTVIPAPNARITIPNSFLPLPSHPIYVIHLSKSFSFIFEMEIIIIIITFRGVEQHLTKRNVGFLTDKCKTLTKGNLLKGIRKR